MNESTQQVEVYRVLACRSVCKLALLECKRGGWRKYRVIDGPLAGIVYNTQDWFPHTTPIGAVLGEIRERARRMLVWSECGTSVIARQRIHEARSDLDTLTELAERLCRCGTTTSAAGGDAGPATAQEVKP